MLSDATKWKLIFGSKNATGGSWDNVMDKSFYRVLYYYIPILIGCYGVTEFCLKQVTDWNGLKLKKLAGQLSMYPAFFYLVYTSHIGSFMDPTFWSSEARFHTSSQIIDDFANFYIACNIVQAIGQIQTEKPPLLYQLLVHHVISIACFTSSFYFDRFRWWEAFAGCCEITNIFLVPVFACKEFFPEWQEQTWYLWNCRLLWITFVIHRLVLFPCWLGLWYWDRFQAIANGTAKELHWVEGIFYPLTILGLFVLSTIWFLAINRGVRKTSKIYYDALKEKQKKQ